MNEWIESSSHNPQIIISHTKIIFEQKNVILKNLLELPVATKK